MAIFPLRLPIVRKHLPFRIHFHGTHLAISLNTWRANIEQISFMLAWSCSTCSPNQNWKHDRIVFIEYNVFMLRPLPNYWRHELCVCVCLRVGPCVSAILKRIVIGVPPLTVVSLMLFLSSCRVSPTCGALTLSAWLFLFPFTFFFFRRCRCCCGCRRRYVFA